MAPLYTVEQLKAAQDGAYIAFNKIQQNGVIDFASQFGDVLDAILLALPVDTPWSQLCHKDGSLYDAFDRNGNFKGQESTYKCLPESVKKPLYLEKAAGDVAPIAYAGADIKVTTIGTVELNGSISHDRNGDALSFNWTQVSGNAVTLTNANTAKPNFAVADLTAASYTFKLTVTANGKSSSDTVTVTVEKGTSGGEETIWQPNLIYTAGDKVMFNGEEYTAQWWTQGDQPGSSAVWKKTNV